jgi:hypothetical protein
MKTAQMRWIGAGAASVEEFHASDLPPMTDGIEQ